MAADLKTTALSGLLHPVPHLIDPNAAHLEPPGNFRRTISAIQRSQHTSDDQFYRALIRIKAEVVSQKDAPFADIKYDIMFDEKVLGFLGTKDFKTAIEAYITKYNELLAASTYLH